MDFFSIFENSKKDIISTKKDKNVDKNVDKKIVKKRQTLPKQSLDVVDRQQGTFTDDVIRQQGTFTDDIKKVESESIKNEIYNTTLYKNIKKGDFVKIIGVKDSFLNSYKGYVGEIKDYKRDQDFAIVFLHGITQLTIIKFPIYHFVITS